MLSSAPKLTHHGTQFLASNLRIGLDIVVTSAGTPMLWMAGQGTWKPPSETCVATDQEAGHERAVKIHAGLDVPGDQHQQGSGEQLYSLAFLRGSQLSNLPSLAYLLRQSLSSRSLCSTNIKLQKLHG